MIPKTHIVGWLAVQREEYVYLAPLTEDSLALHERYEAVAKISQDERFLSVFSSWPGTFKVWYAPDPYQEPIELGVEIPGEAPAPDWEKEGQKEWAEFLAGERGRLVSELGAEVPRRGGG